MRVLVVDDSATMRKIVSLALSSAGYEYEEAGNGKDALARLNAVKFDLVLLDINMPVMGGIEFLENRAGNTALLAVPVIVLTTQDEQELRDRAMDLGARAFLIKPFKKEELLASIQSVVN
ncbi:MAG: response regulator [Spirochaetales bacterium]|nr:response regulator [Spirochaetales bacterium]